MRRWTNEWKPRGGMSSARRFLVWPRREWGKKQGCSYLHLWRTPDHVQIFGHMKINVAGSFRPLMDPYNKTHGSTEMKIVLVFMSDARTNTFLLTSQFPVYAVKLKFLAKKNALMSLYPMSLGKSKREMTTCSERVIHARRIKVKEWWLGESS